MRGRAARKTPKSKVTMEDIRAHLAAQRKDVLVEMLLAVAATDERFRERLRTETAGSGSKRLDLVPFRAAIDRAVNPPYYVDYDAAYAYAHDIEEEIDGLEALLEEGHAEDVIELAEEALAQIEQALERVDDSDGYLGAIIERLGELHHAACVQARPDPVALARRLFAWELRTDYDTFYEAVTTYAGVLGPDGLAEYRRLAEDAWQGVPSRDAGADLEDGYGKRFRITHIMESLARQDGDIEALVAIKRRDLSHAYAYLKIAQVYREAGQHDRALEWAERGRAAFPENTDSRLLAFLADEYLRRARHDEAMALAWEVFGMGSHLQSYQELKARAEQIGQWPAWRRKALAHLRALASRSGAHNQAGLSVWWPEADRSELVRVFLWEADIEAAWREAQEGGCSDDLWIELAGQRARDCPQDAIPVYQDQIERALARRKKASYYQAVKLLRTVRALLARLDRGAEFDSYLASVRATHKRKRNFIKLLDAARW